MLLPFTPKRKEELFFWSFHHCPQISISALAATIFEEKNKNLFFSTFHHCPQIRTFVLAATIHKEKQREAPLLELPSLPADKDFCPCCYHTQGKDKEALHLELPSLPADKDFCPCCYHIHRKEKEAPKDPPKSTPAFATAIFKEKNRKLFIWSFHHCPQIGRKAQLSANGAKSHGQAIKVLATSKPVPTNSKLPAMHLRRVCLTWKISFAFMGCLAWLLDELSRLSHLENKMTCKIVGIDSAENPTASGPFSPTLS